MARPLEVNVLFPATVVVGNYPDTDLVTVDASSSFDPENLVAENIPYVSVCIPRNLLRSRQRMLFFTSPPLYVFVIVTLQLNSISFSFQCNFVGATSGNCNFLSIGQLSNPTTSGKAIFRRNLVQAGEYVPLSDSS